MAFIGQGRHATTNLYPSLAYAGIDLVATCANHDADYTDWKQMVQETNPDALICCVNADMHYEVALECKIPLFIEKPPAPTSALAEPLCGNEFIMVGFNKRFAPVFQEAKRLIPKPISMTISVHVGKCKDKKELLTEVGIHYVDLFRWFGVNGPLTISDELSWERATEHIEVLGDGQLVVIDNGVITYHKADKSTILTPNRVVPCKENHLIFTNGYVGELTHFADCVRSKKPMSPNMYDGYEALRRVEEMI